MMARRLFSILMGFLFLKQALLVLRLTRRRRHFVLGQTYLRQRDTRALLTRFRFTLAHSRLPRSNNSTTRAVRSPGKPWLPITSAMRVVEHPQVIHLEMDA